MAGWGCFDAETIEWKGTLKSDKSISKENAIHDGGTNTNFAQIVKGKSTGSQLLFTQFVDNTTETGRIWEVAGFFGFSGASSGFFGLSSTTDYILIVSGQNVYNSSGSHLFDVNAVLECTIAANQIIFNNGTTDTSIDWATNGYLAFNVGATDIFAISASGLTVTNGYLFHSDASGSVGLYGSAPVGQYTGNATGTLTAVAGNIIKNDTDTFDGGLGGSAYNLQDIVKSLIKIGILAP